MKRFLTPVALGLTLGLAATAQAQNWPVYGGDTGNTRYSASKQINTTNVGKLNVEWALQLGSLRSQESTPILVGDTLYVTSSFGPKNTFAVNAKTGEVKWTYQPEVPKGIDQYACCDVNNRGVAYNDGKIFLGRLDAHIVALDAKTGKELWKTPIVDYTAGSVITSPPKEPRHHRVRRRRIRCSWRHRRARPGDRQGSVANLYRAPGHRTRRRLLEG